MFYKKFAMLVLSMGIATGLMAAHPVLVAAEETTTQMETQDTTDTPVETPAAVPTVAPTVTPSPTITKTPAVSKNAKKIINSTKKNTKKAKKAKKSTKKKYNKADLRLMASIINCEAGGESYQGKVAVGIVVMNRVKSKAFPNTIRKVIYERGQFSPVRNGMLRKKLAQYDAGKIKSAQWKSCIKAAKASMDGQSTVKIKGKTRSMKGVRFFSVGLPRAKFRLGGHRFK